MKYRIVILSILLYAASASYSYAAPFTDITGWAWSDTIGWISFNCLNTGTCGTISYGMKRDSANGNISGYAWNDNVGWISAQSADTTGCPTTPCQFNINNSTDVSGWMKALSAGGGWDGWISPKGTVTGGGTYRIDYTYGGITGWGWGDQVVGWIFFSADLPCSSFIGTLCDSVWKYRDTETIIIE